MQTDKCPISDQLNEFVTGKLSLDVHNAIEQHLDNCADCRDTVEILDENSGTLFTGLKGAAVAPAANDDPDVQQLVDRAKALGSGLMPQEGVTSPRTWTGSLPQFTTGTELGNYVLNEPIGGNMGLVYKAYHKRMKRDVALKFISPQLIQSRDARRRFQREIEAAANPLQESRNVETLRPNPVAERELRLFGNFRVLFNVEAGQEVTIILVGEKRGNSLFVQGEEFTGHESDPSE